MTIQTANKSHLQPVESNWYITHPPFTHILFSPAAPFCEHYIPKCYMYILSLSWLQREVSPYRADLINITSIYKNNLDKFKNYLHFVWHIEDISKYIGKFSKLQEVNGGPCLMDLSLGCQIMGPYQVFIKFCACSSLPLTCLNFHYFPSHYMYLCSSFAWD
jgi:hypothetical protein